MRPLLAALLATACACAPTGLLLRRAPAPGAGYRIEIHMRQVSHTGEVYESRGVSTLRVEHVENGIAECIEIAESLQAGREGEMEPSRLGVGEVRRYHADLRGVTYESCALDPRSGCQGLRPLFGGALPWLRVLGGAIHLPEQPVRPGRQWSVPVVAGGITPVGTVEPEDLECRMHGIEATKSGEVAHLSCHGRARMQIQDVSYDVELELVQRLDIRDAFVGDTEIRANKRSRLGKEEEVTRVTIQRLE